MGEIGEACQVIMIIGKSIYNITHVMAQTAVFSAQAMNTIYSSKWKGKTSLKRLFKIKGEENGLLFLNVGLEPDSAENRKKFRAIKKELKKHGIMYSVMPDLCGGDGNTQICISAVDAKKMEAMLHSHMHGKNRDVYMAEISQYDYTMTGRKLDGSPTPEMSVLQKNADPKHMQGSVNRKYSNLPDKIVAQSVKEHDLSCTIGRDGYTWLSEEPLLTKKIGGQNYHLVTMPDGKSGIIISDQDYREFKYAKRPERGKQAKFGALICADKNYYSVNYKTGDVTQISGRKAVYDARKTTVADHLKQREQILKNQKQQKMIAGNMEQAVRGRAK